MARVLSCPNPDGSFDGVDLSTLDLRATRLRLHFYRRDVRVEVMGRRSVPPDQSPPAREECGDWSRHSRRRLLWIVNNCGIEWATMLTLTYPETWPLIGRCSQVHLANMLRSLKRAFPGMLYLWVREFQKRGAQHFHVLLTCFGHGCPNLRYRGKDGRKGTGPPGWRAEHKWASRRWQEVLKNYGTLKGIRAGLRWELLEQLDGGARYVSQYASKKEQKSVPPETILPGRWWGHSQAVGVRHDVPFSEVLLSDYLAAIEGPVASEAGWLFGVLHNGRERAHLFLPPDDTNQPPLPNL